MAGLFAFFALAFASSVYSQSLPTVDLGYEVHQAIAFNTSDGYYNFSNIQYGEPPIGDLRFTKSIPPQTKSSVVNNGSVERVCPQSNPFWVGVAGQWLSYYENGTTFPFAQINETVLTSNYSTLVPPEDPRTSEDCLYLDMMVPQKIFDGAQNSTGSKNSSGAPVLVWIYGGGYTFGSKESVGNPAGLIKAAGMANGEGVVYVAMNYRLGAFGWISGPSLSANGTANAGLYDQRLALEWVQENVHLFGGDPNRVTVMGESAGAGSIMFQMTAYGGTQGPVPFQQSITQSPAYLTDLPVQYQEDAFQQFLQLCNVSTLQEARQLDTATLNRVNNLWIGYGGHYGGFIAGPVVDGDFVPDLPGRLLLEGRFDKTVKNMNGHNANEGVLFTLPTVNSTASFTSLVELWLPSANSSIVSYITDVLYPPVFDGSLPYTDQLNRGITFIGEAVITCNTNFLDRAFNNHTHGYMFSVPPAFHADDTAYTFYNGPGSNDSYGTYNATVAQAMQQYITSFVETGIPSGGSEFNDIPIYGNGTILDLNDTGLPFQKIPDPDATNRCLFFQQALFENSTAGNALSAFYANGTSGGNGTMGSGNSIVGTGGGTSGSGVKTAPISSSEDLRVGTMGLVKVVGTALGAIAAVAGMLL